MRLPQILKKLLNEKDMSIAQLARATQVPAQTIHNWLCGQMPGNIMQLKRVADYFNQGLDYMCFGYDRRFSTAKEATPTKLHNEINAGMYEVILRKKNDLESMTSRIELFIEKSKNK